MVIEWRNVTRDASDYLADMWGEMHVATGVNDVYLWVKEDGRSYLEYIDRRGEVFLSQEFSNETEGLKALDSLTFDLLPS